MNVKLEQTIVILQVVGGVLGVTSLIFNGLTSLSGGFSSSLPLLIQVIFLELYALSCIAGLLLWKNHLLGIPLSIAVQALQIPQFTILGFTYRFVVGVGAIFAVESNLFKFGLDLGSKWKFGPLEQGKPFSIGLNIVAILFLTYLLRQRNHTPTIT